MPETALLCYEVWADDDAGPGRKLIASFWDVQKAWNLMKVIDEERAPEVSVASGHEYSVTTRRDVE